MGKFAASILACALAACGGDGAKPTSQLPGAAAPVTMTVVNQMPLPAPCTIGTSLTFFEGTTPVDIPYQSQKQVQVTQLFGSVYEIGFQVNGWYWRTCTGPGDCPNPNGCQNPDNAGQVAVKIAPDCSTATLVQNFDDFTCDDLVPNASAAVTVTLQSQSPCTVVIGATSSMLTPTDQCCSCNTCAGGQIPNGQTTHCQ
ncbi:hypothetical protein K2Z84_04250 [Candidatus Binatia bacterium]|nr:hypothetical protein [Candidatus Binatia bacterium]